MKITFEIPDSARCLSITCVWQDENGLVVGQHMADTEDLKDGAVLRPGWGGEADD